MLQAHQLLRLKAKLIANLQIGGTVHQHLHDDVGHTVNGVLPSGAIVPHRGGHKIIHCFAMQYNAGKFSFAGSVNILVPAHDAVSVKAINNDVSVFLLIVDGNDRLRISVRFNGAV